MLRLARENYRTYTNQLTGVAERHSLRIFAFVCAALLASLFARGSLSSAYSMMATGITVLTGFTFTALFSDHALANSGLPKPRNESDRHDIRRLNVLAGNFRARSAYFISLAILEIVLLVTTGLKLSAPKILTSKLSVYLQTTPIQNGPTIRCIIDSAADLLSISLSFLAVIIYLECLYTFYRLADTILAIVNRRRDYLAARD